jgi:hypothetical protein
MAIPVAIGAGLGIAGAIKNGLGATHFEIAAADVDRVRKIRDVAAACIAEKRAELEQLEAELAVLEEALAEIAPDGG